MSDSFRIHHVMALVVFVVLREVLYCCASTGHGVVRFGDSVTYYHV